uniref:(California timema) hypothetical protein n=1 Tax=Timema californicum TaxID=61474 RepID=A0A7R9J798_TIMCA|nr:unnamed protein product [Timema californicum]
MDWFFGFARTEGFPTMYSENATPVTVDVLEIGFIVSFVILAISFIVVMPGTRSKLYALKKTPTNHPSFFHNNVKWLMDDPLAKVLELPSIIVGFVWRLVCNYGQHWEVGVVEAITPYRAGTGHEINASISVMVGLRSVNITLVRKGESIPNTPLVNETINYNERFWWTWDQGRFGFGPYAGTLQQSFRQAQRRGLPLPILWVADYFTWDGEGLRFGRYYRTAGWFTHIALWTAFPCWVLANFFFVFVVRYGAYFTILTGVLQLLACLLWTVIRNPYQLEIPFEEKVLSLQYGINYWLTLGLGLLSTTLGLLVAFLDLRYPDEIALFFGIDPLADYEEYHLTASELESVYNKGKSTDINLVEIPVADTPSEIIAPQTQVILKRRTTVRLGQRSLFRSPAMVVTTPEENNELPLYLNVQQSRSKHGLRDSRAIKPAIGETRRQREVCLALDP